METTIVVTASVFEERPAGAQLAQRVTEAVQDYLDSLPHAEGVRRAYLRFLAEQPDQLTPTTDATIRQWQNIERQAQAVADRITAGQSGSGPLRVVLEFSGAGD